MRLGVVPIQLFVAAPDLVAIAGDQSGLVHKGELFAHDEAVIADLQLTSQTGRRRTTPDNRQCRTAYGGVTLLEGVDELFILSE